MNSRCLSIAASLAWLLLVVGCIEPSGDMYADRGVKHFEKQEYREAIADLEKAVDRGLKHVALDDACTLIGNCHLELENFEDAIRWHQKALDANPRAYKAWVNLGVVHRRLSDYEEAADCYEKAIEINPKYAEAYASLGALHVFQDDVERGVATLEKAVELDDTVAVAHANLSIAYAMDEQFEEARQSMKRAIARGYHNAEILRQRIADLEAGQP